MTNDKGIVEPDKQKKGSTFWFPSTSTLDGAKGASAQTAVAFGAICFGYFVTIGMGYLEVPNPLQPTPDIYTKVANIAVLGIAAGLGWRAYKKPSIWLAFIAFAWVALELGFKISVLRSPGIWSYWLQLLAFLWSVNGVRGAIAVRRFSRISNAT